MGISWVKVKGAVPEVISVYEVIYRKFFLIYLYLITLETVSFKYGMV